MTSNNYVFHKLQAQGNDFVLLDLAQSPWQVNRQLVAQLANRQYGVGCDQLLVVDKPVDGCVPARLYNADGQSVAQCGNGLRAVGYYLMANYTWAVSEVTVRIEGVEHKIWQQHDVMHAALPVPCFLHKELPMEALEDMPPLIFKHQDQDIIYYALHMGNPHAVVMHHGMTDEAIVILGEALSKFKGFSQKTNAGFMMIQTRQSIKLQVYERGAGRTLACGSGACAAVVAGIKCGLLDAVVQVEMPGGLLQVEWQGEGFPVVLSGACHWVFSGQWRGVA